MLQNELDRCHISCLKSYGAKGPEAHTSSLANSRSVGEAELNCSQRHTLRAARRTNSSGASADVTAALRDAGNTKMNDQMSFPALKQLDVAAKAFEALLEELGLGPLEPCSRERLSSPTPTSKYKMPFDDKPSHLTESEWLFALYNAPEEPRKRSRADEESTPMEEDEVFVPKDPRVHKRRRAPAPAQGPYWQPFPWGPGYRGLDQHVKLVPLPVGTPMNVDNVDNT